MSLTVEAICAGRAALLPGDKLSAIAKSPLDGPVEIGPRGVSGDEQVDRKHHGFPAMAMHLYPADHYTWLRDTFGERPALACDCAQLPQARHKAETGGRSDQAGNLRKGHAGSFGFCDEWNVCHVVC